MEMKAELIHNMRKLIARAGGSSSTQAAQCQLLTGYVHFLTKSGALRRSVDELAESTVPAFARYCVAVGMKPRRVANAVAAIRVVFKQAGRDIGASSGPSNLIKHRKR